MAAVKERYCNDCATPAAPNQQVCLNPRCRGTRFTSGWIIPKRPAFREYVVPPEPFGHFDWPTAATMSLTSRWGLGKSSISALLHRPDWGRPDGPFPDQKPLVIGGWITAEQDPGAVRYMFERLRIPEPHPPIFACDKSSPEATLRDGIKALRDMVSGRGAITVIDSLSPFGATTGAVIMMNAVIADCIRTGRRAVFINQTNKAEQVAGSNKLQFSPDMVAQIEQDPFGRPKLVMKKNRHGPTFSSYYEINRQTGLIHKPDFHAVVHSVEGQFPDLNLVPYGISKGVRWAGMLDELLDQGVDLTDFPGYASAAIYSPAAKSGFLEPPDVAARRALAEDHGMKWLTIDLACELLEAANDTDDTPPSAAVAQLG